MTIETNGMIRSKELDTPSFRMPTANIGRRAFLGMLGTSVFGASLFTNEKQASASQACVPLDVWEISTRHLPCNCPGKGSPNFEVYRSSGYGTPWTCDQLDNAIAIPSTDCSPTIIYAHGNWMTRENARDRAIFIANQIAARTNVPFRFVMLSWPSQRERRPVRDILENASCADAQSFYLDWLLRQFPPGQLSLLGFSLGARVVCGALHLEAGGSIQGAASIQFSNSSSAGNDPSRQGANGHLYRVSFAAPAVDRQWLQPYGRTGLAMTNVDRVVNLYNSKDPVLRRFRFIDGGNRPIAAGFAGFANSGDQRITSPLAAQDRIVQYDCGGSIGSTHSEKSYYLECNRFVQAIDNMLWRGS